MSNRIIKVRGASVNLEAMAEDLGYEEVMWDEANHCWFGHGASDSYDRSRDDEPLPREFDDRYLARIAWESDARES